MPMNKGAACGPGSYHTTRPGPPLLRRDVERPVEKHTLGYGLAGPVGLFSEVGVHQSVDTGVDVLDTPDASARLTEGISPRLTVPFVDLNVAGFTKHDCSVAWMPESRSVFAGVLSYHSCHPGTPQSGVCGPLPVSNEVRVSGVPYAPDDTTVWARFRT